MLNLRITTACCAVPCCLQALDYAQQVVAGPRMIPRLRDFQPALVGYALTGQADKAGQVVRLMMEHCQPSDLTGKRGYCSHA